MLSPAVSAKVHQLVRLDTNQPVEGSTRALFGLDAGTLAAQMEALDEPGWRARQIAEAIYRQGFTEIDSISTLPLALRRRLSAQGWAVGRPRIREIFVSRDGTERYLVEGQGAAGQTVETVWMPRGDGGEAGDGESEDDGRAGRPGPATICLSSQVGCAVNCRFCLTAKLGLERNLGAGEIAGQVVAVMERHGVEAGRDRLNLVFMGMGEPFANYDNWIAAVRLLVEEVGLSARRMTVSTSGVVPGIERLAGEPPELRPRLAISLNAPNDLVRTRLMPINRRWPIAAVIDAARQLRLRSQERITFEYVLLGGETDQPGQARELARLLHRAGLAAKVNLIAWNPGPGIDYRMPDPEAVEVFRRTLAAEGVRAYLRRPRGRDIYAACGQLKRTVESSGGD